MKSTELFLGQIFVTLENFLEKATTLNILEKITFNYKIKVNTEEQFSSLFVAFVVDLCNELQHILQNNVASQSGAEDKLESSGEMQTEKPNFEQHDYPVSLQSEQEEQQEDIWVQRDDQTVATKAVTPQEVAILPSQDQYKHIYSCEFCNRKYQTSDKLSKHLCKSAPINEGNDAEFVDNPDSIDSEQYVHPEPETSTEPSVFVCSVCFSSFSNKELFYQHSHSDSSQEIELMTDITQLQNHRKFSCSVCGEVYRSLSRISYHVARCHAGPYQCELCPHVVSKKQLLNLHKKTHHKGVESFFCTECGLGFKLRTSLQKHMVKRHECEQDKFHCQEEGCSEVFSKKIQLTNHRITVHGVERKFLCQVCGHKFMTPNSLSSHLDSHTNGWKFQCRFCHKQLNTKEKLILHVRTHTGEKPFACTRTNCQKAFVSKTKLEEHLQRHRGEKKHKCTMCGKQYANKPDLRSHIRNIHTQDDATAVPTELPPVTQELVGFSQNVYPSPVILQVEDPPSTNELFNNVQYYQEPLHVVRTVTLPVITSYESLLGM